MKYQSWMQYDVAWHAVVRRMKTHKNEIFGKPWSDKVDTFSQAYLNDKRQQSKTNNLIRQFKHSNNWSRTTHHEQTIVPEQRCRYGASCVARAVSHRRALLSSIVGVVHRLDVVRLVELSIVRWVRQSGVFDCRLLFFFHGIDKNRCEWHSRINTVAAYDESTILLQTKHQNAQFIMCLFDNETIDRSLLTTQSDDGILRARSSLPNDTNNLWSSSDSKWIER